MKHSKLYTFFFTITLFLFFTNCFEEPEFKLSSTDIQFVDSLFLKMNDSLHKTADSLCNSFRANEFDKIVDSIKRDRLLKIERILGQPSYE